MRDALELGQRMVLEDDDLAVPAIHRQQHQARKQPFRAGGDRKLHPIGGHHLADLLRGALVQVQLDLRVALAKRMHHRRQHVARLGVRGRDRQRAAIVLVQVGGDRLEAVDLGQRAIGVLEHLGPLRGHARERPPLAHEQVEAELALERLERAADRRLRGAERRGRLGDRQAMARDRDGVLQLMKIHRDAGRDNRAAALWTQDMGPALIITNRYQKMACLLIDHARAGH